VVRGRIRAREKTGENAGDGGEKKKKSATRHKKRKMGVTVGSESMGAKQTPGEKVKKPRSKP